METLSKESTGENVKLWQEFLRGENLYDGPLDGIFGPLTLRGTNSYAALIKIAPTNMVTTDMWAAAMRAGFTMHEVSGVPDKPNFRPLSVADKHKKFGQIIAVPAPYQECPEAINITNGWMGRHLTTVYIRQLNNVLGVPKGCRVQVNVAASEPIQQLFSVWEQEGLLPLVLRWGGCWAPRYVRRSIGTLSSHAWGTAFDINAPWNGLGRVPAAIGSKGSVLPLVKVANQLGFWWGGHWDRPDGMHFEYVGD